MTLEITPEIQAELDRVAGNVRKEEKEKYDRKLAEERTTLQSNAEAKEKELQTQIADATSKLQDLDKAKATAADADKILTDIEAGLLAKIPEEKKSLVPDSLSKADKVRFILKNEAHLYAGSAAPPAAPPVEPPPPPKPGTPPPDDKGASTVPTSFPGGHAFTFAGMNEFATRDADGYQKWRAEGKPLPKG